MRVHIYRNRSDDIRPRGQMHFCRACGGWYGAPHDNNHCQQGTHANGWRFESCACRFCREKAGRPVEGDHGRFTSAKAWQPRALTDNERTTQ